MVRIVPSTLIRRKTEPFAVTTSRASHAIESESASLEMEIGSAGRDMEPIVRLASTGRAALPVAEEGGTLAVRLCKNWEGPNGPSRSWLQGWS